MFRLPTIAIPIQGVGRRSRQSLVCKYEGRIIWRVADVQYIGTPAFPMTLSRSPSPRAEGGWSSPGLTNYGNDNGQDSPGEGSRSISANGHNVTWAGAKKKSDIINGGFLASSQNGGFFKRHMRNLSHNLPRFNMGGDYSYAEKEKLGRGRWAAKDGTIIGRMRSSTVRFYRRSKLRFWLLVALLFSLVIYETTRK